MLIGGSIHAGSPALAGQPAVPSPSSPAGDAGPEPSEAADVRPSYFRSITSISHGSLATAYQAIKAYETETSPRAGQPRAAGNQNEAAIVSGLGIPAAMEAYRDVMGSDEA